MTRALACAAFAALIAAGAAPASEQKPTLEELERELVCPTCSTTLAMSNAPIAERMRVFIRERIEAGDTKSEIKRKLVAEFGEEVLAAPPRRGFNAIAWILPIAGVAVGAVVLGVLARRWRRARDEPAEADPTTNGHMRLDPELDRRVDEELARFEA